MKKNNYIILYQLLVTFLFSVSMTGCVKEIDNQRPLEETQIELHEVVFYAGWDTETKTVLQEDGSVWWSPRDEISIFGTDRDENHKFVSTNETASSWASFIGQINDSEKYVAVYPYRDNVHYEDGKVHMSFPNEQTAKEGTFDKECFASIAVSSNKELFFRNICSGIKFSVSHEGIKRIKFEPFGSLGKLSGHIEVSLETEDLPIVDRFAGNEITVYPPDDTFEVGKYYYVVFPKNEITDGNALLHVTYYTEDTFATKHMTVASSFKPSVFKRLYEGDKHLKFQQQHNKIARLGGEILPGNIDKTTITEVHFHVSDDRTTDVLINSIEEPVYFELVGTEAHYYTIGEIFKGCPWFHGWHSLRSIDLTMFDTSEVSNFVGIFDGCYSLLTVDLSSLITEYSSSFAYMFRDCISLRELDLSSFNTSNATSMEGMFSGCSSLIDLNISSFDTGRVRSFYNMFSGCKSLLTLDVSSFNTSRATNMSAMFSALMVENLDVTGFNTANVTTTEAMFSGCWNLKSINLSSFNTEKVESMGAMFAECRSLEHLDLSTFSFASVQLTSFMFAKCANLKDISMPNSSTPNLQMMHSMFEGCSSLTQIDLSSFDTSNVSMMIDLFMNCARLQTLDLSNFNVEKVCSFRRLFYGCRNLEHLDISSFNAPNLSDAENTFLDTKKLTTLDLGNLDLRYSNNSGIAHWLGDMSQQCYIRCTQSTKDALITASPLLSDSKYIWCTDGTSLPDIEYENKEGLYRSTDYSMDKTVRTVQLASDGKGIDLVVMGDAYSDRLIASGKYDEDMEKTIDAIFAVEPFKTFKNLFNIYIVYAVSENEVIGKSTALSCFDSSPIGSDGWIWKSYYHCATNHSSPGECSPVIVLNSETSDGAAVGFVTSTTGDYMNDPTRDDYHGGYSESVAYVSGPNDSRFDYIVRHEFGHTFGVLMDEYNKYDYAISASEISSWQFCFAYGMWKNVDLVSDTTVKWSKFINDDRYDGTGIGVYEGALYATGAWRPSPESIMNSTDSGYNAPSREAIYYRIHKLAYGKDWNYSFEDFVTYDRENIEEDKAKLLMLNVSGKQVSSVIKRERVFNRTIVPGPDGKTRIKIVMN